MVFHPFVVACFFTALFVYNAKGSTCEVKMEKVGCFNDRSHSSLDELLVYRRKNYNPMEQHVELPRLLCDCAMEAQLRGYSYIGLQYYAECWSSYKIEPKYDRDGPNTNCFNAEYQQCSQDDENCVGGASTNFVYKVVHSDVNTPGMNQIPATTETALFGNRSHTEVPSESTPPITDQPSIPSEPTPRITDKPSIPSEPVAQMTEEPQSIPSEPTPQITDQPSIPSEPVAQMTEEPSIPLTPGPSSPLSEVTTPSMLVPSTSTKPPCRDKRHNCAVFKDYCTEEYPKMFEECPSTCSRCE